MKGVATIDTLGGPQEMTVISEAGVYKLVFTSRKQSKGVDWWGFITMMNGNETKDYHLTIDFAKRKIPLSGFFHRKLSKKSRLFPIHHE